MVFSRPFRPSLDEGPNRRPAGRETRSETEREPMWYLLEDFLEQPLAMKLFLGIGWLCVVIMVASFVASVAAGG